MKEGDILVSEMDSCRSLHMGVQLVGGEKVGTGIWVCFFICILFCFPSGRCLVPSLSAQRVQHFLLPRFP